MNVPEQFWRRGNGFGPVRVFVGAGLQLEDRTAFGLCRLTPTRVAAVQGSLGGIFPCGVGAVQVRDVHVCDSAGAP